jgi:hypothetical protein
MNILWDILGEFAEAYGVSFWDLTLVTIFGIGLYNVLGFLFSLRPTKRK